MDLPWSPIFRGSLVGSFCLVHYAPQYSISASYIKTFLVLETVQVVLGLLWQVILYPKLFSPFRHLPQPKVSLLFCPLQLFPVKNRLQGNFFNGQFKRINTEPTGEPHRDWINNIPNDGLIYYTSLLNQGRLFITSPQALSEVLTTVRHFLNFYLFSPGTLSDTRDLAGANYIFVSHQNFLFSRPEIQTGLLTPEYNRKVMISSNRKR